MTEIAKHDFTELDKVMISKHGFKRVEDIEDTNQKVYTNDSNDTRQLVVVTVIKNAESCSNVLSIVNGSAAHVTKLKEELPTEGYQLSEKRKCLKRSWFLSLKKKI
ncbi:hypothetical protein [Chryseobacterium sp. SIMBA_038]|uniref:hypothetical protein n=1 Tax=Chryseobacterium sp. SIMBA_038 TaxID=3085780 RepID=UPI00397B5C9A